MKKILLVLSVSVCLLFLAVIFVFLCLYKGWIGYMPDMENVKKSFTSSRNGVQYVNPTEISPYLFQALSVTENVSSHIAYWLYVPESTVDQLKWRQVNFIFQKPNLWTIAYKLKQTFTPEELMTLYLNRMDFLYGAEGIAAAARIYFDKSPSKLTIEEAATLAAMSRNPVYFDPVRNNTRCREKRNVILEKMQDSGFLNTHQTDSLKQVPLKLTFRFGEED